MSPSNEVVNFNVKKPDNQQNMGKTIVRIDMWRGQGP